MAIKKSTKFIAGMLSVIVVACAAADMNVEFAWAPKHQCVPVSPELRLTGVPEQTKRLKITMVDRNLPSYNHGGSTIDYVGQPQSTVAEGALKPYQGPCPPSFFRDGKEAFESHDYEITVVAQDAGGKELARASAVREFPPKK